MKQQHTLQPKLRFPEFEGDWDYKPLGEFVSNKSKKFNPKNNEDNLKCVELEHIDQNTGRLLGFISSLDTNSTKNVFKKGEVLYGKLRPYLNKYYYCEFDGVCSSEIWVLSGNNFSNKLISQLTQTNYFKFVTLKTTGSKMPRADWNVLSETEFCVPLDIPEQQKIADYLSTVDNKINLLEEKKAQLGLYKKAMMQKLFAQEIRFKPSDAGLRGPQSPKDAEALADAEVLEAYLEWEEKRLGEVFNSYNGLTGKTKENFGFGKPYIKYTQVFNNSKIDIQNFDFVEINDDDNQNSVEFGDAFFTVSSETPHEVGMSSVLLDKVNDVYLNSFCFGIRPKSKNLNPLYYRYFFRSKNFRKEVVKLAQGSTRYNMSKVEFMKIIIQIPSLPEQQKIADFLSAIDESIEKVTEQITQTQSFKKAMLQQMFV